MIELVATKFQIGKTKVLPSLDKESAREGKEPRDIENALEKLQEANMTACKTHLKLLTSNQTAQNINR